MTVVEERFLVGRAQEGDSAAFEQLMISSQNEVYALAFKLLGNEQDALDISQDAFLKAYLSIGNFRGDSRFSVWMYRVTYNLCLDKLRKKKRRRETRLDNDADTELELQFEDPSPSPEERVLARETSEIVRRGLDSLPPKQRAVLIMREVTGLSYAEIAKASGLREGTVKSRINRARIALAEFLRKNGTFPEDYRHNNRKDGDDYEQDE
ncbi:MAG: RNA polymerase sigma factor [Oscillospiraceae bacterium]|nr:RNA polymerase sigma factor [Oscillospiraceae bacterium]